MLYNVTYISPIYNCQVEATNVPERFVNLQDNTFFYNDRHPSCKIVDLVVITDEQQDAERYYFERFGTECE